MQPARTTPARRAGGVELLTAAGSATDATQDLFARNPDAGKELVVGLDETFGALAADPSALTDTVTGLGTSLTRLATVFNWGPSKQMRWDITVSFTPFRQYTAADCPRYGALSGPRCGGPSVPETAAPQTYPAQLLPGWLATAGPAPMPGLPTLTAPALPGLSLPPIPGLVVPGLTAPASRTEPIVLTGPDAVAALVGGKPNLTELLLLGTVLTGATVTLDTPAGGH
ncbi:hypothetical protein [Nocardia neocaledoniensis]|uniref:hypothetical protein n=1 Tax=Nocardia neocaledoniensis TaxID=236511 RepID=UPI0024549708|nr:hypothetical protein [Nocardia neocaledoniensis]